MGLSRISRTRILSIGVRSVAALVFVSAAGLFIVPRVMGWQAVTVLSGSMEPTINVGGIAFLEPVDAGEVRVGDVVMYGIEADPPHITHRVIDITTEGGERRFQTQGDANDSPDRDLVAADQIEARVVHDVPYLGYVAQRMKTPLGFLLLLGVPTALFFVNEMYSIARKLQEGSEPAAGDERRVSRPTPPAVNDELFVGPRVVHRGRSVALSGSEVTRELVLLSLSGVEQSRRSLLDLCDLIGGDIVAVNGHSVVVSYVGTESDVDAFCAAFDAYGVQSTVRSGPLTMPVDAPSRGPLAEQAKQMGEGSSTPTREPEDQGQHEDFVTDVGEASEDRLLGARSRLSALLIGFRGGG